jgi:hypothetical protein
MFVFRGVGGIFSEMRAGAYLYLCFFFQGSWLYIYRDDSWYLSLFMFVFRRVDCIFTEMIAGTYLYLCFFTGELVVYLQR